MDDELMTAREQAQKHAQDVRGFIQHAGAFIAVGLFFLVVNLLTGPDSLWFYWPMLPWSIGFLIHGWNVFWDKRFLDEEWEERQVNKRLARMRTEQPVLSGSTAGTEIQEVLDRASGLVDGMRASARRILDPDVRHKALDACAASDQVLAAIIDHPDELPLARDFVNRFLEPANAVMSDYSRLAARNVPSARETLLKVEQHDLPLITHKANQLYDRLHRGTLIDLEVAREMLTLDMANTSVPELPARD